MASCRFCIFAGRFIDFVISRNYRNFSLSNNAIFKGE
jgi:hypothetical protein